MEGGGGLGVGVKTKLVGMKSSGTSRDQDITVFFKTVSELLSSIITEEVL